MGLDADQRYKIPRCCCCCRKTALPGCSSPFAWVIENKTRQRKEYSPGKVLPGSWENANGPNRSPPSPTSLDSVMILSGTLQSTCVSTHALTKVLEMNRDEPKPVWERLRELWVQCYIGRVCCISCVHVFIQTRKKNLAGSDSLLHLFVNTHRPWDLQQLPSSAGPNPIPEKSPFSQSLCSVQPKVCFYNISPENLQLETMKWVEENLAFVHWHDTAMTGLQARWDMVYWWLWHLQHLHQPVLGGLLLQCPARDRDLVFAPVMHLQALWHRGEPAELDNGHGPGWGLFPQTKMLLSAVPAAVCSCRWQSPGNPTCTHCRTARHQEAGERWERHPKTQNA